MSTAEVLSNTSSPSPQPASTENKNHVPTPALYHGLATYPFNTDSEYQAGLAAILGHPNTPPTLDELNSKQDLVLRAQCFYFARKFNTPVVKPAEYKLWLASNPSSAQSSRTSTPKPTNNNNNSHPHPEPSIVASPVSPAPQIAQSPSPPTSTSTITTQPEQPPYPISFAAIVDLITNDKPIPGIQEIPNTVLDLGSSKQDKATRRRKPWEKEQESPDLSTNIVSVTAAESIPIPTSPPPPQQSEIISKPLEDEQPQTTTQHDITGSETRVAKPRNTPNEGIVHILKPNAIPDSGLIAKE